MVIVDRTDIADRLEQVTKAREPFFIRALNRKLKRYISSRFGISSSVSLHCLLCLQLEVYDGKGSLEGTVYS